MATKDELRQPEAVPTSKIPYAFIAVPRRLHEKRRLLGLTATDMDVVGTMLSLVHWPSDPKQAAGAMEVCVSLDYVSTRTGAKRNTVSASLKRLSTATLETLPGVTIAKKLRVTADGTCYDISGLLQIEAALTAVEDAEPKKRHSVSRKTHEARDAARKKSAANEANEPQDAPEQKEGPAKADTALAIRAERQTISADPGYQSRIRRGVYELMEYAVRPHVNDEAVFGTYAHVLVTTGREHEWCCAETNRILTHHYKTQQSAA